MVGTDGEQYKKFGPCRQPYTKSKSRSGLGSGL